MLADMDPGSYRVQRQTHLSSKFGFECDCALCTLPSDAVESSDARQRLINEIDSATASYSGERHSHPETLLLVSEKLRLLKAEGMPEEWGHMDMVCAFTHCCAEGNYAAARKWMRRAISAARLMLGDDSHTVAELEAIMNPSTPRRAFQL